MKKLKGIYLCLLAVLLACTARAQFPPPVGMPGTTAIYKDSSAFVAWAKACTIQRGYRDIALPDSGYASVGDSSSATGKADGQVISLGDAGAATLRFSSPLTDEPGWDFAVFENSFNDTFLELAFVEVSSDGINFVRFPAVSNTQTQTQTGSFDATDATQINNLAGKYRGLYGTPFDLNELKNEPGLDISNITHVKVIDVVGSINPAYASYDHNGNIVNDPWPTPFASSGFDLDAVGVIHQKANAVADINTSAGISIFPNPATESLFIQVRDSRGAEILISTIEGKIMLRKILNQGQQSLDISQWTGGIYILQSIDNTGLHTQKILKQ